MGMSKSKSLQQIPNNPFEQEIIRNKEYAKAYRDTEKTLAKQEQARRKQERKVKRFNSLKEPEAPHVPKKPIFEDYNVEAKRRMQNQLAFDSQQFILNQLMLSVQFFGNYEKERWDAVECNRKKEKEETNKVDKHCKIILLPDQLHEAVDKRIHFKARHGPTKNITVSLNTKTMYVVHENIEITNPGEPSVYSIPTTNVPIYKMEIDVPLDRTDENRSAIPAGYIRLRSLEQFKFRNELTDQLSVNVNSSKVDLRLDDDDDDDDDEEEPMRTVRSRDSLKLMSDSKKKRLSNTLLNIPLSGNSTSSTSPCSSEYDYAYLTSLNTRQPISTINSSIDSTNPLSTSTLPNYCISNIAVPSIDMDDDSDSERDHTYELRQYFNSKAFFNYFIEIFKTTIGTDLGITQDQLATATWKGAVIYVEPWEIVPAISFDWPKQAFEWRLRQREIKENPLTEKKYQWPTSDMVKNVVSFGCYVIPLGVPPKQGMNSQRELQWKIIFPEAERYLESCLTSTQVKVYMITKALIKTFIEPYNDNLKNMFTTEHLRAHLFWQCENNYAAWPEDYLGEVLIRFLNALLDCIKRQRLSDYFIPERNLFENIPDRILVDLHKRLFRITENPVMHVMVAMKNIKFSSKFLPKINYKRLYSLLIIDNPLKINNPAFRTKQEDDELAMTDSDDEECGLGAISKFQRADQNDKSKLRKLKTVRFLEQKMTKLHEKALMEKRLSIESVDVKFDLEKHMEHQRRVFIYEIFISHYIKMAESLYEYKSYKQSIIYLNQATRLCSLMKDDDWQEAADQHLIKLSELYEIVKTESSRESLTRPMLPKRDSHLQSTKIKVKVKSPLKFKEFDPYTNIDAIKSPVLPISPVSFSDDRWIKSPPMSRKSILKSPNMMHRTQSESGLHISPILNGRQITTNVQVHLSSNDVRLSEFESDNISKSTKFIQKQLQNGTGHRPKSPKSPRLHMNENQIVTADWKRTNGWDTNSEDRNSNNIDEIELPIVLVNGSDLHHNNHRSDSISMVSDKEDDFTTSL